MRFFTGVLFSVLILIAFVFLWLPVIKHILALNALIIPSIPLVTIESDDWGAHRCLDFGINLAKCSKFSQLDCLETPEDVRRLTSVLRRHHDSRGRAATITANVVFETILGNRVNKTIIRRTVPEAVVLSWKEAMEDRVLYPQLHAMREADEHSVLDPDSKVRWMTSPYMVWDGNQYVDLPTARVEKVVIEGQDLFSQIFGFKSLSTVPPRYVWGEAADHAFAIAGIRYLQAAIQIHKPKCPRYYPFERTDNGILMLTTRVHFEPAFAWKKGKPMGEIVRTKSHEILRRLSTHTPVAISTHRINYVSGHSRSQAEYGLSAIDSLLSNLLRYRPNLVFLTSPELGQVLERGYFDDVFTGESVEMPSLSLRQLLLSRWKYGDNTKRNVLLSSALFVVLLALWSWVFLYRDVPKKGRRIGEVTDS